MAETKTRILGLLNNIAKEQKLHNHDIKLNPISSEGANYTSTLYVATITSENSEDLNVFIKVAAMGEKMREVSDFKIYEVEKFIYTELQTHFRRLEDKHGASENDRLKMSKYYGANTKPREEIIVLENQVSRGFSSHDRMKSVDWPYAASAARELAKLHALSIALEHENPEEYTKLLRYFHFEGQDYVGQGIDAVFQNSKKGSLDVVRKENYEKLKQYLNDMNFLSYWNGFSASKREVFVHGDFRPSNLLHHYLNDGSVEVIPVDYQTLRGGSPVADLLYFIILGTDKQFRAHYYERLIDNYYSELRAALIRLGLNPDEKYSREDFDAELKEKLPFGLAVAVFTLPIVTVEAENAPTVDENMDLTSFSIQKTGSLFPERLNGIVDDFVRWGVL